MDEISFLLGALFLLGVVFFFFRIVDGEFNPYLPFLVFFVLVVGLFA